MLISFSTLLSKIHHLAILSIGMVAPLPLQAATLNGSELSLWWGLPFAFILLSIALCPLLMSSIWHHHFGKITAGWTLLFLLPFSIHYGWSASIHTVVHALLAEYVPFILLLLALYTISGGIDIQGHFKGTPATNTAIIAMGTLLASLMGTTGAAMLLIRPLLKANQHRQHRVHVVVFFIFLVANIGGGLTPLGDPPLFLGFLKGVSFLWTVEHMLLPVLISSTFLLVLFYGIDRYFAAQEQPRSAAPDPTKLNICIKGKRNILLLLGAVGAVLLSGLWQSTVQFHILDNHIGLPALTRDVLLLAFTLLSLWITPSAIRQSNAFNWAPIQEVGKLFLGIFITISPVIAMLQAGENGHFHALIESVHNPDGSPINALYFWMSGLLSAFLDNAPTYLVFFNLAGGDANILMEEIPQTLLAISMGSVFMGALSYIGNAPNFMVKSIAEQQDVAMPSFFAYMLWSFGLLAPLFLVHTLIFFIW